MIQRLRMQNWRSHSDSEFKFSSGVNALLGIMGSGKSSAMDALCFALFGTFPALGARRLTLDEVIRARPQQQTSALVELDFKSREGDLYTIARQVELGKGTKKVELRKNGVLLESANSQSVNDLIEKILKIDYDVFSRAVYSEQNQLDQFLNIPRGQRMERIDKLLKLDRFETARKTAGKLVNQFSDEASSKELLSRDILLEREAVSITELEQEKAELGRQLQVVANDQIKAEGEQKIIDEKLYILEEKIQQLSLLKIQKEGVKERLAGSKERYAELDISDDMLVVYSNTEAIKANLEAELQKLGQLKAHADELEKKKAGANSTIEVLDSEVKNARFELAKTPFFGMPLRDILEKQEGALQELPDEHSAREQFEKLKAFYPSKDFIDEEIKKQEFRSIEFQKKAEACNVRRANSREIIQKLRSHDQCPLCESDITGQKRDDLIQKNNLILQQIDQEATNLNSFILSAKEKRDELKAAMKQWDALERSYEKLQQERKSKSEQAVSIARRLDELERKKKDVLMASMAVENELNELKGYYSDVKFEAMKKELDKVANIKKAVELKKEIYQLGAKLGQIEKELPALIVSEQVHAELREKRIAFIQKIAQQKAKLKSLQDLLEEKGRRLQDLTRKRELAEKYKHDIASLRQNRESLEVFQNALKRTQESLRAEFIEIVNQVMTDVWKNLYPYDDLSGVKLVVEGGDYILSAKTSQGWVNVEGRVSGGERSLACLALRVAFSLALAPNLSWLVLDEPTHNLDVEAIDMLGETLRERLPSMIEQIFLITHEERLESAVSGNLYKLERNKELDEPTRIAS